MMMMMMKMMKKTKTTMMMMMMKMKMKTKKMKKKKTKKHLVASHAKHIEFRAAKQSVRRMPYGANSYLSPPNSLLDEASLPSLGYD